MGMGNYPCYADTIDVEFVKEMCPQELDDFFAALDENDISQENFADSCSNGDTIEEEVEKAWIALVNAFQKATGGLELGVVFHAAEDRGDELDGWAFCVEGVYIYSPAGAKYKDQIQRKAWTVYG